MCTRWTTSLGSMQEILLGNVSKTPRRGTGNTYQMGSSEWLQILGSQFLFQYLWIKQTADMLERVLSETQSRCLSPGQDEISVPLKGKRGFPACDVCCPHLYMTMRIWMETLRRHTVLLPPSSSTLNLIILNYIPVNGKTKKK